MATYVMSDIHGDLDSYRRMLELIGFSDNDELYVLGDVVDRGPYGVEILLDIMDRPNVHMTLGNHEHAMYNALVFKDREFWSIWRRNGGFVTMEALEYREETARHKERILAYLRNLPLFREIEVNGRKFFLVHASAGEDVYDYLWRRPEDCQMPIKEGMTVIVGHTATCYLRGFEEPFAVYSEPGIYYIDCGAGTHWPQRQLGCLRLEDMAEFYVRCVPDNEDRENTDYENIESEL